MALVSDPKFAKLLIEIMRTSGPGRQSPLRALRRKGNAARDPDVEFRPPGMKEAEDVRSRMYGSNSRNA